MYCALYRKYRPNSFDDVVGQDVIIKTLKNSIINEKINHAYLFAGPRGSGKTSIAKIFAQTINCTNLNGTDRCNECVFCTQIKEKQAIDIIEIDAASNNGVDEIREINNKVNLIPAVGKYKVYIIDEVHMLTIGAFNALLKTLEEPPSHVVFILATTDPHKIPTTILSRCQRFDFKKITEKNIFDRIKYITNQENISIDDDAIMEIARLGDGSLRDAISTLDQVIAYAEGNISVNDVHAVNGTITQNQISELVQKIFNNEMGNIFSMLDKFCSDGKNLIKIIDEVILYFRNVLIFKNAPEYFKENNKMIDSYLEISKNLSNKEIDSYLEILLDTSNKIKNINNPKLLFELCLIKMIDLNKTEENTSVVVDRKDNVNHKEEKIIPKTVESPSPDSNIPSEDKQQDNVSEQKNISREINTKKVVDLTELNNFKKNRIDNVLSGFVKKKTLEIKKELEIVNDYLLDEKFSKCASIILDGELKASSDNGGIFVYKSEILVNQFIENIPTIEKLLSEILKHDYKVIATDTNNWDEIKTVFNSNKSKFTFHEETLDIVTILENLKNQSNSDDMTNIFGDIVEYS